MSDKNAENSPESSSDSPPLSLSVFPDGGLRFESQDGTVREYPALAQLGPKLEATVAADFNKVATKELSPKDVFDAIDRAGGLRRKNVLDEWAYGASDFADTEKTRGSIDSMLRDPQLQPRDKYGQVAKLAYAHLVSNGLLYFDARRQEGYWFDGTSKNLFRIESETFLAELSTRLNLNRKDIAFDWVRSSIQSRTIRYARKIEPRQLSYFDPKKGLLYFNHKPGRVLVLDGETVRETDNGEGGVLFLWKEGDWESVDPVFEGPPLLDSLILDRLLLDKDESDLSQEEAGLLGEKWILAVFFRDSIPDRPILALIGEQGSGKTWLCRLIGLMLFGANFEVLGIESQKEDGAIAHVTNNSLAVFDNADVRVNWLPDLLARTATGQAITRRVLYKTNEEAKYPTNCLLAITARQTPWARLDVIDRLLPFRVRRPDTFINAEDLRSSVLQNRARLIGELLTKANQAIRLFKKQKTIESPVRLAAFYNFALRSSTKEEQAVLKTAFQKVTKAQEGLGLEQEEDIIDPVKRWTEAQLARDGTLDRAGREWTEEKTSTELYAELSQLAKSQGFTWTIKSPTALGHRLSLNRRTLLAGGIETRRGRKRTWSFRPQNDSAKQPDQPLQPLQPPKNESEIALPASYGSRNGKTTTGSTVTPPESPSRMPEREPERDAAGDTVVTDDTVVSPNLSVAEISRARNFILNTVFPTEERIVGYVTEPKLIFACREKGLNESLTRSVHKQLEKDGIIFEPKPGQWRRLKS